jgi:hypothetical protein
MSMPIQYLTTSVAIHFLAGPGATFGEVALLKEDDCIWTAFIIADVETGNDLIIVDRCTCVFTYIIMK